MENTDMEFRKRDLLTKDQINTLIYSDSDVDVVKILCDKLKKYILINENGLYIKKMSNNTYVKSSICSEDVLISRIKKFIEYSYKNLSEDVQDNIKLNNKKEKKIYCRIWKKPYVQTLLSDIKSLLINDNIKFDSYIQEIHFENGYINVNDGQFYERSFTKHFVTQVIKRNYVKSTKDKRALILTYIKQIYPLDEDLQCILKILGSCLSGLVTEDCTNLILTGLGSRGKSFVLELCKNAMSCYFTCLEKDTFVINKDLNKMLNTYSLNPQILFSWLNEPNTAKFDASFWKLFCEGLISCKRLYKDGLFNFSHHSKLIITCNNTPNLNIDTGSVRRLVIFKHGSSFVEDKNLVDESKNIYFKNSSLLKDVSKDDLLDAWIDILVKYCRKWMKNRKIDYTDNFLNTKSSTVGCNDYIQDFIDQHLIITDDINDHIGRDRMRNKFLEFKPQLHSTAGDVVDMLNGKNFIYDSQTRPNNEYDNDGKKLRIKGTFTNVRWRTKKDDKKEGEEVEEVEEEKIIELSVNQLDEYNKMKSQLEELQKKLNIYESQNNNNISDDEMNLYYNSYYKKQDSKLDLILDDFKIKHPKKKSTKQPFKINPIKKEKIEEEYIKVIYDSSDNIDDEEHKRNIDNFLNQNFRIVDKTINKNFFD